MVWELIRYADCERVNVNKFSAAFFAFFSFMQGTVFMSGVLISLETLTLALQQHRHADNECPADGEYSRIDAFAISKPELS